ncbi:MAG TPA: hypothetical protein VEK79_03420 [Thermoanaerobaculia bacterium]|nr:hypothetical protein [Thermoanaerobaculia bacterium]
MIEHVIQTVLSFVRVSGGDDLTGFVIDADHALSGEETFENVEIVSTDRSENLLEITATAPLSMATLQDVAEALKRAWQFMAYPDLQATSITWHREATVMRFVTAGARGQLCVTGRVIITAPHQDKIVKAFEEDFSFAGRLPSL